MPRVRHPEGDLKKREDGRRFENLSRCGKSKGNLEYTDMLVHRCCSFQCSPSLSTSIVSTTYSPLLLYSYCNHRLQSIACSKTAFKISNQCPPTNPPPQFLIPSRHPKTILLLLFHIHLPPSVVSDNSHPDYSFSFL